MQREKRQTLEEDEAREKGDSTLRARIVVVDDSITIDSVTYISPSSPPPPPTHTPIFFNTVHHQVSCLSIENAGSQEIEISTLNIGKKIPLYITP
jgi:hypothetical protein